MTRISKSRPFSLTLKTSWYHLLDNAIQADADGVTLRVRVSPRSSKNGVAGLVESAVKIMLTAAPVDGAANEALIELLAKLCKLRKSDITILSGHTARLKRIHLDGATFEEVRKALEI